MEAEKIAIIADYKQGIRMKDLSVKYRRRRTTLYALLVKAGAKAKRA